MNQKEAKNERENAFLPPNVEFVNYVFQPSQFDPR